MDVLARKVALLVEDNPDDAELAVRELRRRLSNLDVVVVHSAAECLEQTKARRFDLVILDYRLPDGDGLVLLRRLQDDGVEAPIIMVTGFGGEEVAVQALKIGAFDYIVKGPNYLERLSGSVQAVWDYIQVVEQRRQVLTDLARVVRQSRMVVETAKAVTSTLEFAQVLPIAIEKICGCLDAQCGALFVAVPGDPLLRVQETFGLAGAHGATIVRGSVPNRPRYANIDEILEGQPMEALRYLQRARLGMLVPFFVTGELLAAAAVGRSQQAFTPEDLVFAAELAEVVGPGLRNARLYSDLRERFSGGSLFGPVN